MNQRENPIAVKSKKEITQALLKLMEQYPYAEITVKQIVLETRLVRKTFYRNFTSKDDVLDSYINNILKEYTENAVAENADILSVIFDFCIKYKDFLLLLNENNMLYLLLIRLNTYIPSAHIDAVDSSNPFIRCFDGLDPDYLIAFNVGAVWNVICKWIENKMEDPPEKIVKTLKNYLSKISGLK